jgi:hypothetical protein
VKTEHEDVHEAKLQRRVIVLEGDNARLRGELLQAQTELESHAWEISPAMAQAKIDQLNAEVLRYQCEVATLRAEVERLREIASKYEDRYFGTLTRAEAAERALTSMTADRDSWCDQADQRATDAVTALLRAEAAEALLAECRVYIAGVNTDFLRGEDDDRDNLLDAIDAVRKQGGAR